MRVCMDTHINAVFTLARLQYPLGTVYGASLTLIHLITPRPKVPAIGLKIALATTGMLSFNGLDNLLDCQPC
jgi:hypothetical protein